MAKLHLMWLAWGPVLFCFAITWLLVHPHDWTGPAVVAPLSALYGAISYRYAFRRLAKNTPDRLSLLIAMIGAPVIGLAVSVMIAMETLK